MYGRPSVRQEARVEADGLRRARERVHSTRGESRIVNRESRAARRNAVRNTPGGEGSGNMSGIYRIGGYALLVSEVDSS